MRYDFSDKLKKILNKLKKKDSETYKAIKRKIKQVVDLGPEHYKHLRHGMKHLKRAHIKSSFVLVFEYDKQNNFIQFLDYDHHDKIYKR
jgi:YafQ family addiction module toxin component